MIKKTSTDSLPLKRPHTIPKINDNKNIDSTKSGSMNAHT